MRIAICTPWSRRSAVARSSRALAGALSLHAEVTVYYPVVADPLASSTPTVPGLDPHRHRWELQGHDHVIHAIGDHPWHQRVREVAALVPGVVVLHDLSLANLAWDHAVPAGGVEAWLELVATWHGPGTALRAREVLQSVPHWSLGPVDPMRIHFRRWVLTHAAGVLVHSGWAAAQVDLDRVREAPVVPVPLAYPLPAPSAAERRADDLVVVTGSLHADRHAEVVIRAVARVARRRPVELVFVGGTDPARVAALREAADHAGEVRVRFAGAVDDAGFSTWLRRAAVVVNLRQPVLQTGSATVLEQLAHGCPTIVLDHGPFAELPDDVVVKVTALDEGEVASAILALLADPSRRRSLGAAARAHADEHHQPEAVGAEVAAALARIASHHPTRELSHQLAHSLRPLVVTGADPLAHRVGATADELFGRTFDGPDVPLPPPPAHPEDA